ncbi:MAG: hypothetical protein IKJ08_02445 [Alistipes sp.]|nr:hypothetical protein [Alistipes sp.]
MKRATSIISAFCLGLFISIGILACAVDDYATPNANNPSSDLQLCKMEVNYTPNNYQHINISYNNDGRISTITTIYHINVGSGDGGHHERTYNITYNQNKIIISFNDGTYEYNHDYIFNNELDYYSTESINNQVFNCLMMLIWLY